MTNFPDDILDLAYAVMATENITLVAAWEKVKPYEEDLSKYPLDEKGLYMLSCIKDSRKDLYARQQIKRNHVIVTQLRLQQLFGF